MAVERITVPLGGGLVASTVAENATVVLCPGCSTTGKLPLMPQRIVLPATHGEASHAASKVVVWEMAPGNTVVPLGTWAVMV